MTDTVMVNQPSTEEMREFDSVILSFMKEQGIPGASLCVSRKGKILYTQSEYWEVGREGVTEGGQEEGQVGGRESRRKGGQEGEGQSGKHHVIT